MRMRRSELHHQLPDGETERGNRISWLESILSKNPSFRNLFDCGRLRLRPAWSGGNTFASMRLSPIRPSASRHLLMLRDSGR
jgi:hypothetical protein